MNPTRFHEPIVRLLLLLFRKLRDLRQQPSYIEARTTEPPEHEDRGDPPSHSSYIWDREIDGPDQIAETASTAAEPTRPARRRCLYPLAGTLLTLLFCGFAGVVGKNPEPEYMPLVILPVLMGVVFWAIRLNVPTALAEAIESFKQHTSGGGPQRAGRRMSRAEPNLMAWFIRKLCFILLRIILVPCMILGGLLFGLLPFAFATIQDPDKPLSWREYLGVVFGNGGTECFVIAAAAITFGVVIARIPLPHGLIRQQAVQR